MSIDAIDSDLPTGRFEAEVLDLTSNNLLRQVETIGEREGGLIDCWVPTELIDHEEVPVKEEWAQSLAQQMREMARVAGGTGQLSPIILGLIEGESTLKIIDGFHRDAALEINGEVLRYATVKRTDWDGLYDVRIFTAKDHAHVRFSRVVQWIREIWGKTGLPDMMTVEQAVLLYRFDTDGSRLGLDPVDVEAAKAWIARKEEQWQMAAMTIHSHLKVAEHVDPRLVHSTREKKGGRRLEAPTQAILKIFSEQVPNRFDLQNLVMDIAMQHNLKGPQVKALCLQLAACRDLREAEITASLIDPATLRPEYHEATERALRRAYDPRYKGAAVLARASQDVSKVTERIGQSLARKEEVTAEMQKQLNEARRGTQTLIADLGNLVVELTKLIEHKPPTPAPALRPQQPHKSVFRNPTPPKPQQASPPTTRSSVVHETIAPAREHTVIHRPATPLPEAQRVEGESEAATRFKQELLDYLNGRSEVLPRFINRSHIVWAEAVLAKGAFSGHPQLVDDVHDIIDTVRQRTSEKIATWRATHKR